MEATLRNSDFTGVSFDLKYGPTVEAKLNDETFKLLIDTGSTFSVLDAALAERLGLTSEKHTKTELGSLIKRELSTTMVGVGEIGAHKMWVTTLKTLKVGSLQWTNVHFGVTDLKSWGLAKPGSQSEEVQALLGRELLKERGARIDFHSRKLWLRPVK